MANLTSSLTIKLIDDVSKPARSVADALKAAEKNAQAVAKAMSGTGASNGLTKAMSSLKLSAKDIDTVKTAWQGYATSAKLAGDSTKWTKSQAADVKAWERQTVSALRAVKREQDQFHRSQQRAMNAPGRGARALTAGGAVAGVAAGYAGSKAIGFAREGINAYRQYSDINAIMRPVMDLSPAEQASLKAQQRRLGVESRYSPSKIAEAQKLLGERGIGQTPETRGFVEPYVRHAVNYASAMNVELPEAVKTLEANVFSTGKLKGLTNPADADKMMRKVTDFSTHLAKISGMSDTDISNFYEYGGLSGKQAGLSDETAGAIAALMKRNQISGDKAGVAMRAIAAKLVSPTAKGLAALDSMGISYGDYAKQGPLSGDTIGKSVARKFGKRLSPEQLARLQALNDETYTDEKGNEVPIVGDRMQFVPRASEIIAESFDKNKKGKVSAQDYNKIAGTVSQLHQLSVESIDTEGLLKAMSEAKATLAQLNAYFGFQQGSRAGAALMNPEELQANRQKLLETPEGYAQKIAEERLNSFDGKVKQLEGSIETLQIRVAEAADNYGKGDGALSGFVDALTAATNKLIGADDKTIIGGAAAAGGLAAWSAGAGIRGAISGGLGGGIRGALSPLGWLSRAGAGLMTGPLAPGLAVGGLGYFGTQALESARLSPKEAGKTYTSDFLLNTFGGKLTPRAGAGFDAEAYARKARGEVDTGSLDKAKESAEATKEAVDGLNATVRPNVDVSGLQAANREADALLGKLSQIGSLASGAASKISSLGAIQRGRFSFGGVQGE